MSRTFQDSLTYDAENVLLNTNEWGENATHYADGETPGTSITVLVFRDEETNSGTGYGDGNAIDDPHRGSAIKRAIRLEMLASVVVTEAGQGPRPSCFLLADGTYCQAVRVLGKDDAMQLVLCTTIDRRSQGRVEHD